MVIIAAGFKEPCALAVVFSLLQVVKDVAFASWKEKIISQCRRAASVPKNIVIYKNPRVVAVGYSIVSVPKPTGFLYQPL